MGASLVTLLVTALLVAPRPSAMTSPGAASERWLVVDFDGTCTVRDTTPILPHLASSCTGDSAEEKRNRLAAFGELEGDYFDLYEKAKARVFDVGEGGDTQGGEGRQSPSMTLDGALEALDDVSTEVTRRVSASGVLAGISDCPLELAAVLGRGGNAGSEDAWVDAATLHPGCVPALAAAHRAGWHLGVLSINWCPPLIEAALLQRVRAALAESEEGRDAGIATPSKRLSKENIWSNAVNSEGVVELPVPGAAAKRARIASLKAKAAAGSSLVVYIGDTSTDLLGLLEADIGILIGRSKSTELIADRWGVPLVPLAEREIRDSLVAEDKTNVWVAQHWEEIERVLERFSHDSSSR